MGRRAKGGKSNFPDAITLFLLFGQNICQKVGPEITLQLHLLSVTVKKTLFENLDDM